MQLRTIQLLELDPQIGNDISTLIAIPGCPQIVLTERGWLSRNTKIDLQGIPFEDTTTTLKCQRNRLFKIIPIQSRARQITKLYFNSLPTINHALFWNI
ncbi:hypothetical protein HR52_17180 [Aeromonas hydrophila]|nr:hypothetical protein HR52_17180 [Aeromonas hydrophila]OCA62167.1 hypothetical protein A9R12_19170 [Aeromonas hydrophila]OCY09348.1 hypothetical protein A9X69_03200 [Aeromonas hydrophila]OCY10142.1 hypothetical protein A9X70_07110 [Aeromonas hydrophila]